MAIFKFLDLNGLSTLLDQLSAKFVKKSDVESELSPTSTNPIQNKTVNTELNKKLSTNGGTMSGNINMGSNYISNVDSISFTPDDEENSISIFSREDQGYVLNIRQGIDELPIELNGIKAPENDDSAVPKSYVDDAIMDVDPNGKYLKLSGGALSGNLSVGSHDITNVGSINMKPYAGRTISFEGSAINTGGDAGTYGMLDFKDEKAQDVWLGGIRNPINDNQAATKKYVDDSISVSISELDNTYLKTSGGIMNGDIDLSGNNLEGAKEIVLRKNTGIIRGGSEYQGAFILNDNTSARNPAITLGVTTLEGEVDFGSTINIKNVKTPTENNDAANKQYVDEAIVENSSNIVELTKAEYDEMVSSDTIDENTYYAITDDELNTDDFTPDIIYQNNRLYIKTM